MDTKLLIVDDDPNICDMLKLYFENEGYKIKTAYDGAEGVNAFKMYNPDLVLLDIMMPRKDGWQVCREIREISPKPVIMITAKTSEFDKVTGLDMGADDYITKPFGMTELASRVNAVLRRYKKTQVVNTKEYSLGKLYVNPEKHIIKLNGEDLVLSFKEYSLLLILLEADGKVVSREELLTKVWGEFYEESRTLDVHIRKLRVKLENSDVKIETVKNIGYKIGGAESEQ